MDSDLFFVCGLVVAGFAIPSVIGAFSQGRPPRAAAILLVIAGGLIVVAFNQRPSGYTIEDFPSAFSRVINRYLN